MNGHVSAATGISGSMEDMIPGNDNHSGSPGFACSNTRPRLPPRNPFVGNEPALTFVLTAADYLVQITRVLFTPVVLLGALHGGPSSPARCD